MVLKALMVLKYYNIMLKVTTHSILMWLTFSLFMTKRGREAELLRLKTLDIFL